MVADLGIHADPAADMSQDGAAAGIIAELAEALADVLYVIQLYPVFRFEYVSSSVERVVGHTAEEHYADPGLSERLVDPRDLHEFAMWIMSSPDGPIEFTKVWKAKDGHDVWAQHRCLKQTRLDGSVALYGAARDVTAQVAAEHALASSEEMYRLLAENASDVVWRTNTSSIVEWVSPSVVSVIGWTPDDMVGRAITELVHPEDADRVRQAGDQANDGGRVSFEARYQCKDGTYRWLEITARPVVDAEGTVIGRVGSCRDVHSEVEAWQALERSEQRFSMAMESAPIGMAVLDLEGRFIEVNVALCRMLGHETSWLLEHRISDVLHPQDGEIDFRMRDQVLSGATPSSMHEVRLLNRRREIVWVQQAVGLLRDEEDMPLSYVAQFVNVTEAREARETLRFMATHDPLTQLLNRRELLARMSSVLAHSPRGGACMAVLFADLDGLKPANDTYGHSAGDQLIVEAARRIAQAIVGNLARRIVLRIHSRDH